MGNAYVYGYRGDGLIENRHRASIAVTSPAGQLLAYTGNPELEVHLRSSAKPFQVQALFLTGGFERFGITPEEIALSCASHTGTPRHIELVTGYLEKIGLDETYLNCGAHYPLDDEARREMQKAGEVPSDLHNNCSGKHTGMLATALAMGADPKGYELPEHPVQQLNFKIMRELSGHDHIPFGIDGCSVPAFVLPLAPAARMFALMAEPQAAPPAYHAGLEAAFQAMNRHPELVAGEGVIDTDLMRALPNVAVKRGADGYYGMAIRGTRWGNVGVTLKIESGLNEYREPLVIKLLETLGVLSPDAPSAYRRPLIYNVRKLEVGHIEARLELTWVKD
ncbi:MAG: asparaginase [Meiothermus sp.]|nr:asparaginase [Meiothermus sp.]